MNTLTNTATVINSIRYTVKGRAAWETFVTENKITRDMISETAKALASLAYPNEDTVQTVTVDGKKVRTTYGNAVQAAAFNLRNVLADEDDSPKEVALRVSLSGEGGGSAKVDMESELGKQILAFLAAQN